MDIEHCLLMGGVFLDFFLDGVLGSGESRASVWGCAICLVGGVIGMGGVIGFPFCVGVGGGKSMLRTSPGGSVGTFTATLGVLGRLLRSVLIADNMLLHSLIRLQWLYGQNNHTTNTTV